MGPRLIVIGTSPSSGTSVAVGPYIKVGMAQRAAADLTSKGWKTEIVELQTPTTVGRV